MEIGFEAMYNLMRKGKRIWERIYSDNQKNTLFYVVPEADERILCSARQHMQDYQLNRNIVVISTEKKILASFVQAECVKLNIRQMEYLLIYLRSCRDVLLNLNLDNVFVLSFMETGGNSLQKLYEEGIYEEEFLIERWLLPKLD